MSVNGGELVVSVRVDLAPTLAGLDSLLAAFDAVIEGLTNARTVLADALAEGD